MGGVDRVGPAKTGHDTESQKIKRKHDYDHNKAFYVTCNRNMHLYIYLYTLCKMNNNDLVQCFISYIYIISLYIRCLF